MTDKIFLMKILISKYLNMFLNLFQVEKPQNNEIFIFFLIVLGVDTLKVLTLIIMAALNNFNKY